MSHIRVAVTLLSRFRQHQDKLDAAGCCTLPAASTVLDLADMLQLDRKHVVIFLINGRQGTRSDILHNNDAVVLVPPAVGGG